jgi:hypothetical protein
VGPVVSEEEVAGAEVEEGETRSVEGDVEAVLDVCDDRVLVDVVVAGIDYAEGFGVAFLGCTDGGPEDSFAASPCIARYRVSVLLQRHARWVIPEGVEETNDAVPLMCRLSIVGIFG